MSWITLIREENDKFPGCMLLQSEIPSFEAALESSIDFLQDKK